ncbi:hypothetical protein SAMN02745146_0754 [Hymenobacter daecheongensis DSM 21074]|uniref:Uncharacterized protein n=1 Tax=Hymenobacter daecheongensis DSM 21074 TaxID=1121955 RepID=A0A1M6ASZ1_9BACT|nr:hypothetical protein [Hymenobacter daecheongensis]SHI39582.1 hypothetical protein SAMN02745146_0754 [Hymenobacter daecheongensis DSM 21074]
MTKFILLLLCALLVLADPTAALAEPAAAAPEALTETLAYPRVPRPVYKRYRGNSRNKHRKPGFFRRMKLRRQARRKQSMNTAPRKRQGVIKVDAPTGTMPKPQQ